MSGLGATLASTTPVSQSNTPNRKRNLIVAVTVKELDGSREVTIEAHGGSVFIEGRGFAYEFDEGIFMHSIRKAILFRSHLDAAVQFPPRRVADLVADAPVSGAVAIA